MPRLKKSALLLTGAFALTAGIAVAAPKADTNQDGQISKAEFMAAADARFADTDTNLDGVLTKEEGKAHREARRQEMQDARFKKMDLNGDGSVSQDEHRAAKAAQKAEREKRRDINGDGVVDAADKAAFKEKRKARKAAFKERRAERKKSGERPQRIKRDANEDGVVTRAEFDAATAAMFARLDVNGDGVLSEGEGRKRRKGKRGKGPRR